MMFCLKIGIFTVQKALIYYIFKKSHLNSFILFFASTSGEYQICGKFQISYSTFKSLKIPMDLNVLALRKRIKIIVRIRILVNMYPKFETAIYRSVKTQK